jgi:S-adenosylmethionine-diacylgycerolhomoserine-N-methlytransferase
MDTIYARQRFIYNFTRKYYLLGRDRLIAELDAPFGGAVLEIGCGTGRNLIKVARRYPDASLYGIDISAAMLATARADIARAGLAGRITLAQADATAFDPQTLFGTSGFARVYFSYTLSMIPDWRAALAMAMRVLSPDGQLHLVDFGQQERLPELFRASLHAWLTKFEVTPVAELQVTLSALSSAENNNLTFKSLYRGYAWAAILSALSQKSHQTDIKPTRAHDIALG